MPAIHMSPPAPRTHEESISQRGWTVTARKAPIIGSPLLEEYSEALGSVLTLPEILFGNSSLQLRHEASGVVLSFAAFDALKQWKLDNLPPLKVPVAKEWQAARQQEIAQQQAVVLDYDWTYSTSYAGTLACGQPGSGSRSSQAHAAASGSSSISSPSSSDGCNAAMAAAAVAATSICDGGAATAASDAATQQHVPESEQVSPPAEATAAASCQHQHDQQQRQQPQEPPTWQPTSQQIDRGMLMSKSEPILFYAEVPLYESELDDNGVCQLSVKVRVMPRCWLVLLRFWLRVDGCLVRLREVRHFCRLDSPQPVIIRETKCSEGTMQELAAAGAPASVSGYEDADAATAVFSAIAPQCLKQFELHELRLLVTAAAAAAGAGGGC